MTTDRTDLPESLDERSTLLTMLDYTRNTRAYDEMVAGFDLDILREMADGTRGD